MNPLQTAVQEDVNADGGLTTRNIRIGIISHIDQTERKIVLPENERKANMLRRLYRWSKIEHEGVLWEDLKFFKYVAGIEDKIFNIWEMPILSGVHVESVVRSAGRRFTTLRINSISDDTHDREYKRLKTFDPDCIFLSTTFLLNTEQLTTCVRNVREQFPTTPLVLGGNYINKEITYGFDVDQLLKIAGDNVYIVNSKYGEEEILKFLNSMVIDKATQKSMIMHEGKVVAIKAGEYQYPIEKWRANYDLLDYEHRLAPMRTAAGCPFSCNFCSYPESAGKYLTEDVEATIKELKILQKQGVKIMIFTDDTFNVPLQKFHKLLTRMIEEGLTTFQCFSFCRCQYLTEETAVLMKACGFSGVLLGIESGSDSMLEHMNKKSSTEVYRKGIALLKKNGVSTFSAIIIGHPGETAETVKETRDFLNSSELEYCYLQPFYYLHNSPIHKLADQYELIGKGLNWKHKTMNSSQAFDHLDKLIFDVTGPVFANEEYAMWEMIYFLYKGFSKALYKDYRHMLNEMRREHLRTQKADTAKHYECIKTFQAKYQKEFNNLIENKEELVWNIE